MKPKKMSLYGMVFLICFFLIVMFFFPPPTSVQTAQETTKTSKTLAIEKAEATTRKDEQTQPERSPQQTLYFTKIQDTLNQVAASFDGSVGITYIDLTTKETRTVNGTQRFYAASTIKIPLAMLIAQRVTNGELHWEDNVSYQEKDDYEEGTGMLINDIQPTYSLRTLQEYNILYSDNIAKNMLYRTFGSTNKGKEAIFQHFFHRTTDPENPEFTANDAAEILLTLYTEKENNQEYQNIYDYMKRSVFHERMATDLTRGQVAHKIGSYNQFIHDIGIFESSHPFILTVYTKGKDNEVSKQFISDLTNQLWTLQNNEYPAT